MGRRRLRLELGMALDRQEPRMIGQCSIELGRVGPFEPEHMAGEFNDRALQAETETEERQFLLPSELDRGDFAADAPVAEPARYEQAVHRAERVLRAQVFDIFSL